MHAVQFVVGMVQDMVPLGTCAPGCVEHPARRLIATLFKIILDNGMCVVFFS